MTPHGVAAIAGGDLLLLSGTRARTLLRRITASSIGYSGKYDELWLPDTFGITIYQLQYESGIYRRPDINVRSILQAGTEIMMADDGGRILVSSTEDTLANIKVKWEGEIPHPLSFPAWLGIDLEGDDLDIKATLRSRQRDINRLHINGSVRHVTGLRILGPIRSRHSLRIEGTASGDITLRQMTLRTQPFP